MEYVKSACFSMSSGYSISIYITVGLWAFLVPFLLSGGGGARVVIWLQGDVKLICGSFTFPGIIKDRLVCCRLFFHPPSILDLTVVRLQNPICQPGRVSVRDLWYGASGGRSGHRSFEVGVGLKTVWMCLTHSEVGFQRWGRGEQRAIMPVRMCWLFSVLCLHSAQGKWWGWNFLRLENAKVELRKR